MVAIAHDQAQFTRTMRSATTSYLYSFISNFIPVVFFKCQQILQISNVVQFNCSKQAITCQHCIHCRRQNNSFNFFAQLATRQSQTADSAPGVATWEVTLSARKVVPCVRWPATLVLLRTVYCQAQGCACTALHLGVDIEQPWLMSKHDVIHKTGST